MNTTRLEAFSDGVIAIIITIMVLELKVPHGTTLQALTPLIPVFLSYVLSFTYVGIYWNNHHHMLQRDGGYSAADIAGFAKKIRPTFQMAGRGRRTSLLGSYARGQRTQGCDAMIRRPRLSA